MRKYTEIDEKLLVLQDFRKKMQQELGFTGKARRKPTHLIPKKKKRKK